jgi:hypothetical protein
MSVSVIGFMCILAKQMKVNGSGECRAHDLRIPFRIEIRIRTSFSPASTARKRERLLCDMGVGIGVRDGMGRLRALQESVLECVFVTQYRQFCTDVSAESVTTRSWVGVHQPRK